MSRNNAYWDRRAARSMWEQMEDAEKIAETVSQVYRNASRYIRNEMQDIFERYQTKFKLTHEEAVRLLGSIKDAGDIQELKRRLAAGDYENKQELIAELESPAYRVRIDRLETLQKQLDEIMKDVYRQELEITTGFYQEFAQDAYYRGIYKIQALAGYAARFAHIDAKKVDRVMHSKWSGQNYSARIWGNTKLLADQLKKELLTSLVTGRTEFETSTVIQNRFEQSAGRSRRLIRTESNYLSGELDKIAYKEMDVEKYRYVAVLDLRTSEICQELDGKVFAIKDAKPGVNYPPMHPWCRSTTVPNISQDNLERMKRTARDPETGKTIIIPASMTYREWYKEYAIGQETKKGNKTRYKSPEEKQYEKYKAIFKDELPETFEEFTKWKYNHAEKWNELKEKKQEYINRLDDEQIKDLNGKLGNLETRKWYKNKDEQIPEQIKSIGNLEEQAKRAHELRNNYRTQARDLMVDQEERKILDRDHPNITWEQLLMRKKEKYGLVGEQAYKDIIRSSTTTNKKFDKKAGIT